MLRCTQDIARDADPKSLRGRGSIERADREPDQIALYACVSELALRCHTEVGAYDDTIHDAHGLVLSDRRGADAQWRVNARRWLWVIGYTAGQNDGRKAACYGFHDQCAVMTLPSWPLGAPFGSVTMTCPLTAIVQPVGLAATAMYCHIVLA
jgi:hypothetical protein